MKINSHKLKKFTINGFDEDYIFSLIKTTNDFYEIEVLDAWNHYFDDVEIILDVGANIGNHSIYWSQKNDRKIVAFEPVKNNFNLLEKNIKDNNIKNVEIHQLGLGETEGFAIINNRDSNNWGATSLTFVENEEDIKIISGDTFLVNKKYSVDLIKIDVEGFEIDVLKGFKKTVKEYKPILWIEVNLDTLEEVLKILDCYNYKIIDILKFNILTIHETKLGDLKPISREYLIFNMLKNLEASWMYRNNFLTAEKQKNQEEKKIEELQKLSEKRLAKFLYEHKKFENLKKENENLETLVKKYKSRKIVKFTDTILKTYLFIKSSFQSKKNLKTFFNGNNGHLKNVEQTSLKSRFNELTESKPKKLKDIKVAVILDEFSYNCFKYEFNTITVEPSNWFDIFETEKPDLFLCESAWSGTDSELRPWKGQIYSSINFKGENRAVLLDILEYCNENAITTIFWNKEDPTHYDDESHNFVDTAIKFDHIFTTAEECVTRYKEDYGHQSVHLLMFAAQPKLFNPIEKQKRSKDVIFAGSWYGNLHVQRSKEMVEIFDNILDSGYNLKIYNRAYYTHKDDPNRIFPKKYSDYINPPVPFDKIEKIYKESEYALNINTVTDSSTMFARRVFELMLCNTFVLSNYSKGMFDLFGNNITFIGKDKLDLSNSEEKRIHNLYNVLKNHTYSKRVEEILNSINYEYIVEDSNVTFYYVVNSKSEIKEVLEHYKSIDFDSKKLVLLISDQIPNHLIKNVYKKYANEEIAIYSLNYLLTQNGVISNNTPYFIFANIQMKKDFVEKAILHYSYIESDVGIRLGDEFIFEKTKKIKNVLFSKSNFIKAFENIFKDDSHEFSVYDISI